jgi:hypothetical protein
MRKRQTPIDNLRIETVGGNTLGQANQRRYVQSCAPREGHVRGLMLRPCQTVLIRLIRQQRLNCAGMPVLQQLHLWQMSGVIQVIWTKSSLEFSLDHDYAAPGVVRRRHSTQHPDKRVCLVLFRREVLRPPSLIRQAHLSQRARRIP